MCVSKTEISERVLLISAGQSDMWNLLWNKQGHDEQKSHQDEEDPKQNLKKTQNIITEI